MTDDQWYYAEGNVQRGPVAFQELKALVREGRIRRRDLVWCQGMEAWKPAGKVTHLWDTTLHADAETSPDDVPHEAARLAPLETLQQAWQTFVALARDPVGHLHEEYHALGPRRAARVGLVFMVAGMLCVWLGGPTSILAGQTLPDSFLWRTVSLLVVGVLPLLVILAAGQLLGDGSLHQSVYLAGAALLPLSLALAVGALLGSGTSMFALPVYLLGFCTTVLMLYQGCRELWGLASGMATLATPVMLVASAWAMRLAAAIF